MTRAVVRRIQHIWGDTYSRNMAVAHMLTELRPRKSRWPVYGLPMCYSWGRRLMKTAADARIAANAHIMPGARRALHRISLLRDQEFAEAIRCNEELGRAITAPAEPNKPLRGITRLHSFWDSLLPTTFVLSPLSANATNGVGAQTNFLYFYYEPRAYIRRYFTATNVRLP